jgi:hypothetical protein
VKEYDIRFLPGSGYQVKATRFEKTTKKKSLKKFEANSTLKITMLSQALSRSIKQLDLKLGLHLLLASLRIRNYYFSNAVANLLKKSRHKTV